MSFPFVVATTTILFVLTTFQPYDVACENTRSNYFPKTVPEHPWRLLMARNARTVVPIDPTKLWDSFPTFRFKGRDAGDDEVNVQDMFYPMKRFVIERHIFDDAPIRGCFLGSIDVPKTTNDDPSETSSSSSRAYLELDRYATIDVFHTFDSAELDNDNFGCDADNGATAMFEILSIPLVRSIVERIVDDDFAYWRILFRYGTKLIDVASTTVGGKSAANVRNVVDHDTIRIVVQDLDSNIITDTYEGTKILLNHYVNWAIEWNRSNDDAWENIMDIMKKIYHSDQPLPPPVRTSPTTSLLYFNVSQKQRRHSRRDLMILSYIKCVRRARRRFQRQSTIQRKHVLAPKGKNVDDDDARRRNDASIRFNDFTTVHRKMRKCDKLFRKYWDPSVGVRKTTTITAVTDHHHQHQQQRAARRRGELFYVDNTRTSVATTSASKRTSGSTARSDETLEFVSFVPFQ